MAPHDSPLWAYLPQSFCKAMCWAEACRYCAQENPIKSMSNCELTPLHQPKGK